MRKHVTPAETRLRKKFGAIVIYIHSSLNFPAQARFTTVVLSAVNEVFSEANDGQLGCVEITSKSI